MRKGNLLKVAGHLAILTTFSYLIFEQLHVVAMVIPTKRIKETPSNPNLTSIPSFFNKSKILKRTHQSPQILRHQEVEIYNKLDAKLIAAGDHGPNAQIKNKSIFFAEDGNDSDSDMYSDLLHSEKQHKGINNSSLFLNNVNLNSEEIRNSREKNKKIGFLDLLHTLDETNQRVISDPTESDDQFSKSSSPALSNFTSISQGTISSWEWTQVKRQKKGGRHTASFLTKPLRREKRSVNAMCQLVDPLDPTSQSNQPLKCYQCDSNTADRDPQCDHRLFRYLRHSERFNIRKRCPQSQGDYCMKTVKKKFGERITERGCFTGPIIKPDGKTWNSRDGCFTYPKDGYVTTTCFCSHDLCNQAVGFGPGGVGSLFSVVVLCIAFALYGLTFAYVEKGIGF